MIKTEAWILKKGAASKPTKPGSLELDIFIFPEISEEEVLVEPIFGCWEGNMSHAVNRDPIDVCLARNEEAIVLGNAGVVRVLQVGKRVQGLAENDLALVFCNGIADRFGYPEKIYAYDAPNTVGLLAKKTKIHYLSLIKIPENTKYSLEQWAAFSLRYITAWANWKIAFGCWRIQMPEAAYPKVWGWGGGVTYAELTLAQLFGCEATMIGSSKKRLEMIEQAGMSSLDRKIFPELEFDEDRYENDSNYRKTYLKSEALFLEEVKRRTAGFGVDIFVDFVGAPVLRVTLKALARQGVITTAGWKEGMEINSFRAIECIQRHLHINTHYARRSEAIEAIQFAETNGWMPNLDAQTFAWTALPELARQYDSGSMESYFPIFSVNPASSNKNVLDGSKKAA